VKVLDVNLLLHAMDESSPKHEPAQRWLESLLSGRETVGLPWAVLLAFLRLSTRAAIFTAPLTADEALDVVEGWLALPVVVVVEPGGRHLTVLRDLLASAGTAGNLVSDAHLAALAVEHGAQLCSCDADFSRFAGVDWLDPLR
jgi:toxin-antitoxin system PIN domain toxin